MNERRNRRRFIIPVILLIAALGLGVVFAATTGLLTFSGTATIAPNAYVIFEDCMIEPYDARDTTEYSNNYQTISFTVHLDEYGDTKTASIRVFNSGNVPVVLSNLNTSSSEPMGINVTWPAAFNGLRLEPETYSDYYDVVVNWSGFMNLEPGSYDFSATLQYDQTT